MCGTALVVALALALTGSPAPRRTPRPAAHAHARRAPHTPVERRATQPLSAQRSALERARGLLASVKRDPAKRRFRHHWERAIRALVAAARGKDAPTALLDAARARYGLYRFSAVEADREEALRLATRAARLGARDAPAFAAAIRHEAGEEPPSGSRSAARTAAATRAANASPTTAPSPAATATPSTTATPTPAPATPTAVATAAANATSEPTASDDDSDPVLDEAASDAAESGASGAPGGAVAPEPSRVSEVRTWSNADYTRIAIYLSRPVSFEKTELASEGERRRRLALDLRPALLEGKALARPVGGARVERVRAAQRDADTVRVVLDLSGADAYQLFSLDDPPRLIVDVGTREAQRAAQASALPVPERPREPPEEGEAEARRRPVRRVVVDAGHGGHDTGAIGPRGVREKDVVLAIAMRVARKLHREGFEVVLTRGDDRFLPLEERTAIANAAHADLFVSIHANAHPRRDRSGVETYVLNVADDRYAARLAARENGALSPASGEGREVRRILADLDAKASAEASLRLARAVQREICAGVRDRVGEVRDLGVKSALFYVLLGARMPAVLVETAFISNGGEERRLASRPYQDEVSSAIARAVRAYAGREARLAAR